MLATVITVPSKNSAVIDAGSKTLSGDTTSFGRGYGSVADYPKAVISKLSEEHGYLEFSDSVRFNIGDRIRIIPNHACVVPNLADEMYVLDNGELYTIRVEARGRNK